MKISRRDLLKTGLGGAAAALLPPAHRAAQGQTIGSPPFVLLVYCSGGWDTTMVLDPKRDSSFVTRETGAALAVAGGLPIIDHPSRPAVKAWFRDYGANAAIINGLTTGSMVSRNAARRALGTVPPSRARATDWLSFYVNSLNPIVDVPHAVIDAPYMPGDLTSVAVRLTTAQIAAAGQPVPAAESLSPKSEAALRRFRTAAYNPKFTDAAIQGSVDNDKLRALYYAFARSTPVRSRLQQATEALGPQGGDSDFARAGKVAVELFANGASQAATVQCGANGAWDTTSSHFARAGRLYQDLFHDLTVIFEHAENRGILSNMVVIVTSELGRAPRVDARGGKGPWPYTSALIWGAPFAGGTVAGATDDALRGVPIDPLFGTQGGTGAVPLEMAHVMAALYLATDVPVKLVLPDHKPLSQLLASVE